MAVIDPFKIESELDQIVTLYAVAHANIDTRRYELTPEGRQASFIRETKNLAARLEAVRADLDNYRNALNQVRDYERARILPEADAIQDTATELAVNRILSRPGTLETVNGMKWGHERFEEATRPLVGTPAATLIATELEVRGQIDASHINYLLGAQPRYRAVDSLHSRMLAGLNNVLLPLVQGIEARPDFDHWGSLHGLEEGRISLEACHEKVTITDKGKVTAESLPE